MKYSDEKFYWTYQRGVGWLDDYIGPDLMTHWIIEKSQGFTDVGLYRISESVRAHVYLIASSQASTRSNIIGNTESALTTQKAFLNNFEDIVNPLRAAVEKSGQCGTSSSHSRRENSTEKHQPVSEGISWEPRIVSSHTAPQKTAKKISFQMTENDMMVA